MEVHHKPKPWHGWREFLKEYGIIVLGVLTALAAEQAAEALHRRHEIAEARAALQEELAWNLMAFDVQSAQAPCTNRRLDELKRWADLSASGGRPSLAGPIGAPPAFGFRTSIWRAVAPTVAQMPLEQRLAYAQIYDDLENAQRIHEADRAAWRDMAQFREGGVASPDRRGRLDADIEAARAANTALAVDEPDYKATFARLGVKASPRPDNPLLRDAQRAFCAPLLVLRSTP